MILENIKNYLEKNHNSYYENIRYEKRENRLYIELNNDNNELNYYKFIIDYDEYDIRIYDDNDEDEKIERFSINHIQFDKDEYDIIISEMIDNFFISFHLYHFREKKNR